MCQCNSECCISGIFIGGEDVRPDQVRRKIWGEEQGDPATAGYQTVPRPTGPAGRTSPPPSTRLRHLEAPVLTPGPRECSDWGLHHSCWWGNIR